MGKHSLDDRTVFLRSAVLFVLKWLGIGVLPLLAILGLVRLINQPDEPQQQIAVQTSPSTSPSASPSPQPSPEASPETSPVPSPSPTSTKRGSVQVLNGSNIEGQGTDAGQKLKEAGFEVVAVQPAAKKYDRSTVFYQPGFEAMAREAATVVGAKVIEPAPDNLDKKIPVTVVIGNDYKP